MDAISVDSFIGQHDEATCLAVSRNACGTVRPSPEVPEVPGMSLPHPTAVAAVTAVALLALAGCSRSNNVLLGRVETHMSGHRVAVTDCYQFFGIPEPRKIGAGSYQYAPCKDTVVVLQGDTLFVNGVGYGDISAGDSVTVDHGRVLINGKSD